MVLLSFLPGGREFWLCSSTAAACTVSPIVKTSLLLFALAKADCFSERFLYVLTSALSVALTAETLGRPLPAFVYAIFVVGSVIAHLPSLSSKNSYNLLGYTAFLVAGYATNTLEEVYAVSFISAVAFLAKKTYIHILTLRTSTPTPIVFPFISHIMPRYHFSPHQFFRADSPSESIAQLREQSFAKMKQHWDGKFPKSIEVSNYLSKSFSDLRFAGSNRVFIPFMRMLETWCDPCTVIKRAERTELIDVDEHRLLDISGSYGVNVCGYDLYKRFLKEGLEKTGDTGCVLGPVLPILQENINIIKEISKKDEISFHMSGTEAVMCAVRLCRFNTEKRLIVVFGGAYHGWWDGVQPMAGNERTPTDVLTLVDMQQTSLDLIKLRRHEIAAVVVNPLQAFHPNKPPPSDLVLASNTGRDAAGTESAVSKSMRAQQEYREWLLKLRTLCTANDVVLVFDEVYTGFRLAVGGAQEYFSVTADMVVYGKTIGGGMPIGVVCGPSKLMKRTDAKKPLRVAYVIGTFSAHPLLLGSMNSFLKWVTKKETKLLYSELVKNVNKFVEEFNKEIHVAFDKAGLPTPIAVSAYSSVWTIQYLLPGRYHWLLQYYLKDEGLNLSWVGTGRLSFSLDFTQKDFDSLKVKLTNACKRMFEDGWWLKEESVDVAGKKKENLNIQLSVGKEMVLALLKRVFNY